MKVIPSCVPFSEPSPLLQTPIKKTPLLNCMSPVVFNLRLSPIYRSSIEDALTAQVELLSWSCSCVDISEFKLLEAVITAPLTKEK